MKNKRWKREAKRSLGNAIRKDFINDDLELACGWCKYAPECFSEPNSGCVGFKLIGIRQLEKVCKYEETRI